MAIDGYIGWPSRCNQIILDSTTVTFGDASAKTDELESGLKRTRLRSGFNPEKYSVTMEFEWAKTVLVKQPDGSVIDTGKSEFQHFVEWYKYKHKFGTIPFAFPKIVYSSNTGIKVYDLEKGYFPHEFYKITSAVEGSKSGTKVKVNMTWETVYSGSFVITEKSWEVQSINVVDGYFDIIFSSTGESIPISAYTFHIDEKEIISNDTYYDGSYTIRVYFPKYSDKKIHSFRYLDFNSEFLAEVS